MLPVGFYYSYPYQVCWTQRKKRGGERVKKPSLKIYRRIFQILIIILFIAVPILNKNRYSLMYGNLLSFKAWVVPLADPLADPLAVLQLKLPRCGCLVQLLWFVGATTKSGPNLSAILTMLFMGRS
jgi:hypothetical protein